MAANKRETGLPFRVGDKILVRTVTQYQLGKVSEIGADFITFSEGGWVADIGRFGSALSAGSLSEFERAPSWFMVGRGAIVDVYPWDHEIPRETK